MTCDHLSANNTGDTELPAVKEVDKDTKDAHRRVRALMGEVHREEVWASRGEPAEAWCWWVCAQLLRGTICAYQHSSSPCNKFPQLHLSQFIFFCHLHCHQLSWGQHRLLPTFLPDLPAKRKVRYNARHVCLKAWESYRGCQDWRGQILERRETH